MASAEYIYIDIDIDIDIKIQFYVDNMHSVVIPLTCCSMAAISAACADRASFISSALGLGAVASVSILASPYGAHSGYSRSNCTSNRCCAKYSACNVEQ